MLPRDMIVNQTIFYHVASGFAMDFLWCDVTIIMVNEARIRDENIRSTVVFFVEFFRILKITSSHLNLRPQGSC